MIDRAKNLLLEIVNESGGESASILEEVRSVLTLGTEKTYKGMTAGPNVEQSDSLIIVEGRNDVRNLLKFGIKNSIATMGANVKDDLVALAKTKKTVTAFTDGDRGGSLLLMEISGALGKSLTHVALAPESREVEHLEGKVITKCLNQKEAASKAVTRIKAQLKADDDSAMSRGKGKNGAAKASVEVPENVAGWAANMSDLKKNHAQVILADGEASESVGASKLADFAEEIEGAQAILFNGKVNARIVEIAELGAIPVVLGNSVGVEGVEGVAVYSMGDLE